MAGAARQEGKPAAGSSAKEREAKSPRHDAENAANFIKDSPMIGPGADVLEAASAAWLRCINDRPYVVDGRPEIVLCGRAAGPPFSKAP
jgi:hypothetical protein